MIRRAPPVRTAAAILRRAAPHQSYLPAAAPAASAETSPASLPAAPRRGAGISPAGVTVERRWYPRHLAAGSAAARDARAVPAGLGHRAADAPDRAGAFDRLAASATMIVAAALAVAVSVVVAPRLRDAEPVSVAEPSALVTQGAAVYASSCAGCHGGDLKGGASGAAAAAGLPPPLDASGHAWLHSDVTLFRMVKFGIANCLGAAGGSQMPNFADRLDDRSIRAAIAFVKSRWPNDFRIVQNAFNDGQSDTAESQEAVLCAAICAPPAPAANPNAAAVSSVAAR
jgi:mono/diheme cytochrome c family protein